mmetsp:Transcript_1037/g.2149  ORF Transcript_1037/g.2149 Transcript_1037/m.2149 type:complete len:387 (+) Transcript_1037:54-1214(+)
MCLMPIGNEVSLLIQTILSKDHSQSGNVCLLNVVSFRPIFPIFRVHPMHFQPVREPRVDHTVSGNFAEICCAQLPYLCSHGVLLHQRFSSEMDLQRVVCRQGHLQASRKELWKGVSVVVKEEGIVGQWAHAESNLGHVVQVLEAWRFPEIDSVCNIFSQQKRGCQMVQVPCLSAVRAQGKCVEASRLPQFIQRVQICVHIVCVVGVRWVVLRIPLFWGWHMLGRPPLWFGFVVHQVKPADMLQKYVQHWMCSRIDSGLEHGQEYIVQELLEVFNDSLIFVHIVQPGYLYHPQVVVRVQPILHHPCRQRIPFDWFPPVDGDSVLCVLVLGCLKVVEHFFCELCQEPSVDNVLLLDEDFAQPGLPERIILEIELVKSMKDVLVCMHIQ